METLKKTRPNEIVFEYTKKIHDKSDVPYVTLDFDKREKNTILVVTNHTEQIVDMVLGEIGEKNSGYLFFASELDVDPINNCMVPVHRRATDEEIAHLVARHINMRTLPVLKMKDPIRRWHNFPKGSIVAIERPDSVYFRRVL